MDVRKNNFESEDAARTFFEGMGFSIERHPFTEVADMLVSQRTEGLSAEQVEDSIGQGAVYVMRVV